MKHLTRYLKFLAPADDAGGGAAVADAPEVDTFSRFEDAMKVEQAADDAENAPVPTKEKKAPKAKAEKASVEKAAPKTAIEAALNEAGADQIADAPADDAPDPLLVELEKAEEGVEKPAVRDNIVKMRERIKTDLKTVGEQKSRIAALEQQVSKGDPKLIEENSALKTQLAEYKDAIVGINVEYDPEFRAKYVKGREDMIVKAERLANEYGGDVDKLKEAMQMRGKHRTSALREALEDVDPLDQPRIIAALDDIEKLDEERAGLQKDPQQAWEKLQKSQQTQAQARAEEADRVKDAEFARITKALPAKSSMFRTVDPTISGGEDWNKEVKTAMESTKHLLGNSATYEEIVTAAAKGARYDSVEKMLLSSRSETAALKKQLADYEQSEPTIRGGKKTADEKPKDAADRYNEALSAIKSSDED